MSLGWHDYLVNCCNTSCHESLTLAPKKFYLFSMYRTVYSSLVICSLSRVMSSITACYSNCHLAGLLAWLLKGPLTVLFYSMCMYCFCFCASFLYFLEKFKLKQRRLSKTTTQLRHNSSLKPQIYVLSTVNTLVKADHSWTRFLKFSQIYFTTLKSI